jgi:hypothetical protein
LEVLGFCAKRPLAQSHFHKAPWFDQAEPDDLKYCPSEMSVKSLQVGMEKVPKERMHLDETLLLEAEEMIIRMLRPIWGSRKLLRSYEEAVQLLTLVKSPGFPWNVDCRDKLEALLRYGGEIQRLTEMILAMPSPSAQEWNPQEGPDAIGTFTLKDELRDGEKVAQHKTRVFVADTLHKLLVDKMLFSIQNELLQDNLGKHPSTVGIRIPGPEFVRMFLDLLKDADAYDSDIKGSDLRLPLPLARSVRNIRAHFLPESLLGAIHWSYNWTYCGAAQILGVIYRKLQQSSGSENTAQDNGLAYWVMHAYLWRKAGHTEKQWRDWMKLHVNGDDEMHSVSLQAPKGTYSIDKVAIAAAEIGVEVEFAENQPRSLGTLTYLSHSVKWRYVEGIGEVLVTAGNLSKLRSSLYYVKDNATLSMEESCLAHLLGVRLCLFPWKPYFDICDSIIDEFLQDKILSPLMSTLLNARLTENQILALHTRVEGLGVLDSLFPAVRVVLEELNWVLKPDFGPNKRCNLPSCVLSQELNYLQMLAKKKSLIAKNPAKNPAVTPKSLESIQKQVQALNATVGVMQRQKERAAAITPVKSVVAPAPTNAAISEKRLVALEKAVVSREKEKEKKKDKVTGRGGWDFLTSAVRNIAKILPSVLPLFFAAHRPTALALSGANPQTLKSLGIPPMSFGLGQQLSSPMVQGAPLALPFSMSSKVGFANIVPTHKEGKIVSMRYKGCDFVTSIGPFGGSQGDVIFSGIINPISGMLANTRLASTLRTFEKYKIRGMSFIYEPACPTTEPGQLVMYCDSDPVDKPVGTSVASIQIAGAHEGADVFNVWSVGACPLKIDSKMTDLFVDAEGSDERFIDAGKLLVLANTDLTSGPPLGSIYVVYDIEGRVPQLDNDSTIPGPQTRYNVTPEDPTAANPWGTFNPNLGLVGASTLNLKTFFTGTTWGFYNFPIGEYLLMYIEEGTYTAGSATAVSMNGFGFAVPTGVFQGTSTTTDAIAIATLQITEDNSTPLSGMVSMATQATGAAVTGISFWAIKIVPGIALGKVTKGLRTAQDYQKVVLQLMERVDSLEKNEPVWIKSDKKDPPKEAKPDRLPVFQTLESKKPVAVEFPALAADALDQQFESYKKRLLASKPL